MVMGAIILAVTGFTALGFFMDLCQFKIAFILFRGEGTQ